MRRLFWVTLLLGAYIWSVTTGRDQFVLDQGKRLYQMVAIWLDHADVDFQITKAPSTPPSSSKKKRSRRWD